MEGRERGREKEGEGRRKGREIPLNVRHWQTSTAVNVNPGYVDKIFILSIQFNKHGSCLFIYKMEIIIAIYLLGFLYRLN